MTHKNAIPSSQKTFTVPIAKTNRLLQCYSRCGYDVICWENRKKPLCEIQDWRNATSLTASVGSTYTNHCS